MAELVEIHVNHGVPRLADADHPATHRVSHAGWVRYRAAFDRAVSLAAALVGAAEQPVFVTPDQEEGVRAIAKVGAWIVVREATAVAEVTVQVPEEHAPHREVPAPAPATQAPPARPTRPRPGPCVQRSNLPHAALRYIITEAFSEYDPGRIRIDGLCQCGERIPDVQCPHQKQELNEAKQPACKWCRKVLIAGAGVIDNRLGHGATQIGGGGRDPQVALPVPADMRAGDDMKSVREAYRAPE